MSPYGNLAQMLQPPTRSNISTTNNRNIIFVRGLKLDGRIGTYAQERMAPQPIVVDIECVLPGDTACHSDRIEDTVDYAAVADRLRAVAMERHYELVEAMAHTMAETIRCEFGVPRLRLTVVKIAPMPGVEVGVTIERGDL